MKNLPIRRFLAGILSLILVLGLAACGKDTTKKPVNMPPLIETNPDVAGLLLLNIQAEVQIAYDKDGKVLYAEGTTSDGVFIATALSDDLQGAACADVAANIVSFAIEKALTNGATTIVVKQQLGSATPSSSFLKDIQAAIEKVTQKHTVFTIAADELDELGYLSFDAADAILRAALSLNADLKYPGTPYQISGLFSFTIPLGTDDVEYCVNANSGAVSTAESLGLDFETEETIPEPDIPEDPFPEYPDEEILDMPETPD